ncbi:hypothetical protein TRV_03956 [Trichophyton verrucosum HKI 0517]|uniref:Uncharacterized protein n=1 Tax=Trichophyton verrucosum (strain HKI 0517) TaxID=663202 RepID=D4DA12_TRIVH|nr:uncharacterized protein TRV_03956 [Trichophyton verrucosum HKI 0517]EFE41308.1 hypothetical protein TRV_03956 [Trichophyton verrucosum HKI 0517]
MEHLPAAPNSLSVDRLLGVGEMGQFLDLFPVVVVAAGEFAVVTAAAAVVAVVAAVAAVVAAAPCWLGSTSYPWLIAMKLSFSVLSNFGAPNAPLYTDNIRETVNKYKLLTIIIYLQAVRGVFNRRAGFSVFTLVAFSLHRRQNRKRRNVLASPN